MELTTKFNALQARVVQDTFKLMTYQELIRNHRESMEKRIQKLKTVHLLIIGKLKNLKNNNLSTTTSLDLSKYPFYYNIPPPDP